MLFNSPEFVFVFLPLFLAAMWLLSRFAKHEHRIICALVFSLGFYAYWNPVYLPLILLSILFNYFVSVVMFRHSERADLMMVVGVAGNLAGIAFFKYGGFIAETARDTVYAGLSVPDIVLPLAISFFTFQQISYIVDVRRGHARPPGLAKYAAYVSFFPQLIAGPIVQYRDVQEQFSLPSFRPTATSLILGLTVFGVGLFKKTVIADSMIDYVRLTFRDADAGEAVSFLGAWFGALSYGFQIYFDFSGYSDMAIGLGLMVGIVIPINFCAPYRATSIIEFWKRWHITLSSFLRRYLYIPLGGNRKGTLKTYRNIVIVMMLGGLWHGAGWTFIAWGAIHTAMIVANHAWRKLWGTGGRPSWTGRTAGWILTFTGVTFAWVFFRAETLDGAMTIVGSMVGLHGIILPDAYAPMLRSLPLVGDVIAATGIEFGPERHFWGIRQVVILAVLMLWVLVLPSSVEFFKPLVERIGGEKFTANWVPDDLVSGGQASQSTPPSTPRWSTPAWAPKIRYGIVFGLVLAAGIFGMGRVSEFLYFQF